MPHLSLITKNKPWLNPAGKPIPTHELKQISKSWSAHTWEEYLRSLEVNHREIMTSKYDQILKLYENSNAHMPEDVEDSETSAQNKKLHWAMSLLTEKQRTILQLIYWEGYSESEVADQLGTARGTVNTLKERAIRHLKMLLQNPGQSHIFSQKEEGVSADFHIYRGPQTFYQLPFRLN